MDLLGVLDMSVERTWKVSSGEMKLRSTPPDTLGWHYYPFRASLFHIVHGFYDYDLMPLLKNFYSRH